MASLSRQQAEELLFAEARALDDRRYEDWFAMLTADALYWVPCNGIGVDPTREISLIYDNHAQLRDRLDRLATGLAHAQNPASRTRRVIGNVQLDEAGEDYARVFCTFLLYELRRAKERLFAGHCEYRLRCEDGCWKIAVKKAILENNDEVIDNLTFIV